MPAADSCASVAGGLGPPWRPASAGGFEHDAADPSMSARCYRAQRKGRKWPAAAAGLRRSTSAVVRGRDEHRRLVGRRDRQAVLHVAVRCSAMLVVMTRLDRVRATRYLIPVQGLGLPDQWTVAGIVFHPGDRWQELLDAAGDDRRLLGWDQAKRILESSRSGAIAEVTATGSDVDAIDALSAALDALRLFQFARREWRSGSFGLPGDVYQSPIEYVALADQLGAAGFRYRGHPPGYEFTTEATADWDKSRGFQFLNGAVATEPQRRTEGQRRAVLGTQLFARAALEHWIDLKMLGVAAALEAWLLVRQPGAQALRLARHVAWFGCGRHNSSLCGRDRPACPYLRLSPDDRADRRRLAVLRELGNEHLGWRCAEWHRVMDWYDARSSAAHGEPQQVSMHEAEEAEYWVAHYLAEPILEWLSDHQVDPIGDLHLALSRIDEPGDWPTMVGALDADPPPDAPPLHR